MSGDHEDEYNDQIIGDDESDPLHFLPNVLHKAAQDTPWTYALETKSGQQFLFGGIDVISEEWICLHPAMECALDEDTKHFGYDGPVREDAYAVKERGVDIRLDAIAWVACGIS